MKTLFRLDTCFYTGVVFESWDDAYQFGKVNDIEDPSKVIVPVVLVPAAPKPVEPKGGEVSD